MADVWDHCPRGDWLVWLAQKINAADDRTLRLFAVWCALSTPIAGGRVTGGLLTDPRSIAALEVAERYANGQAAAEQLAAAARAADAAYADAGYNFAAEAAYAACADAYADAHYDFAAHAAYAAADAAAAYAAYAAFAATLDAYDDDDAYAAAAKQAQADQFRLMVPNPFPRTKGGAS
jgi:methionine synthase II (cobalamin-independent)